MIIGTIIKLVNHVKSVSIKNKPQNAHLIWEPVSHPQAQSLSSIMVNARKCNSNINYILFNFYSRSAFDYIAKSVCIPKINLLFDFAWIKSLKLISTTSELKVIDKNKLKNKSGLKINYKNKCYNISGKSAQSSSSTQLLLLQTKQCTCFIWKRKENLNQFQYISRKKKSQKNKKKNKIRNSI